MQMFIFLRRKNSVIQNKSRLKNRFKKDIFCCLQIVKKIELNDNIYIFSKLSTYSRTAAVIFLHISSRLITTFDFLT
jgi:hypothetical protein